MIRSQTGLWAICLRLWITGNNVVNNFDFLPQTDRFTSQDLNLSSGATGINFGLICFFDSKSDSSW